MKAIVLAVAASTLLAAPVFARERGESREHGPFVLDFEDFGAQFEGLRGGGGRLGVQVSKMTEELRVAMGSSPDTGILVNRVLEDSAAKKAGVQVGDIIVEVAGEPIDDVGDVWKVLGSKEGDVKIEVIREKRHVNLTAKIEKPAPLASVAFPHDPELRREVEELRAKLKDMERRLEKLEKK